MTPREKRLEEALKAVLDLTDAGTTVNTFVSACLKSDDNLANIEARNEENVIPENTILNKWHVLTNNPKTLFYINEVDSLGDYYGFGLDSKGNFVKRSKSKNDYPLATYSETDLLKEVTDEYAKEVLKYKFIDLGFIEGNYADCFLEEPSFNPLRIKEVEGYNLTEDAEFMINIEDNYICIYSDGEVANLYELIKK